MSAPRAALSSEQLLERLGARDRSVQRHACDALAARLRGEPELRERVIERLRSDTPGERFAAAFVLFHADRPGLRLLPVLLEALELEDGDMRWQATHMLAMLGRLHGEVLPVALHEVASAESPLRRRMALYVLRELAPERAETARTCLQALEDPDADVRHAALTCFGKLGDPDRAALSRVLEILREGADPRARRIAAVVLPRMVEAHPDSRAEVRALIEGLRASDDASLARAADVAAARLADVG